MNIQLTLTKEEFEPMLLEILSKAMSREVSPSEIKSVSLNYEPQGASKMNAFLEIPPQDANP